MNIRNLPVRLCAFLITSLMALSAQGEAAEGDAALPE